MMRRGLAIVAGVLLGASACMAANYYRQMLMLPRAVGDVAPPAALTASLLLHFDEANGSTTPSDSGKYGLVVTSVSGARVTNSPAKFDNACDANASARRFEVAWTNDFAPGTNNWSFDTFVYLSGANAATNALRIFFGGNTNSSRRSMCYVYKNSGSPGTLVVQLSENGSSTLGSSFGYDITAWSNSWVHLAVYRYANILYVATNGAHVTSWVTQSTNLTGRSFSTPAEPYRVGGAPSLTGAYLDEFRYCVGSAMPYRGTNFTPPTAAYTGYE